jgi:hypothetical protein
MPGLTRFLEFVPLVRLPGIVAARAHPGNLDAAGGNDDGHAGRHDHHRAANANPGANAPVTQPRENARRGAASPNYSTI